MADIADIRGRVYALEGVVRGTEIAMGGATVSVDVVARGGHVGFTSIVVHDTGEPVSPRQLCRMAWELVAEAAIIQQQPEARDPDRVAAARRDKRTVDGQIRQLAPKLKAEAQALGVRWDTYAAERTGYSANYLRQMVARLEREA